MSFFRNNKCARVLNEISLLLQMASLAEVLSSGCSVHLRFVVCSAFAPLCSEEVSGAVSACRAVCDSVAEECRARLPPGALDCGAFPLRPDRRLCMRPPNATDSEPEPPPAPVTPARWPDHAPVCPPGGDCRPGCLELATHGPEEKRAAEAWITALAWLSLVSTSFALLTFCAEPARYRYPERPAVWMAACHSAVALAHVARGWLGSRGSDICTGEAPPACIAFFSLTYYFTLAADAWLANACVSWYLTAASEWSTEALERAAAYLHAVAWGWAGAWTAAALALRRVAEDEVTGACGVADGAAGALVGVPRGALLCAAAALAAAATPGVARVRRALGTSGARRVGRLAARAAAAGALYLTLAGASATARVLEAKTGAGTRVSLCLCLACGIAAGAWAWSRKSALVWRRALCPPRKAPCCAPPLLRPQHPYYKRPLHVSRV